MTPDEFTIQETFVEVGDDHTLYVQEWGNSKAKTPIVFLHGGPGGGTKNKHRDTFDPIKQRVIFFDQRGCGKSVPYGSLEHNTTADLVEDIEKIATYLKLKDFVITGGSWGSALAFFYALKYPKRVKAMVLNGILTGSYAELDHISKGGFRSYFPNIWDQYLARTPKSHHHDPSTYHFKRALGDDEMAAKASTYAYENLERGILALDDRFMPEAFADYDPTDIRMEMYYVAHRFFMPDRFILDHAHTLTMPIWLVQGRYDVVCPPVTAYELSQKLPNGHLIMTLSGHKTERESWTAIRTILSQWG